MSNCVEAIRDEQRSFRNKQVTSKETGGGSKKEGNSAEGNKLAQGRSWTVRLVCNSRINRVTTDENIHALRLQYIDR